jgi:anti-sigma-K factor RskA
MAGEDDLDLLAGEYVLGVLPSEERAAVERRLLDNPGLAARVAAWQDRLAPLAEDLAPETPRPQVWQQIRHSLGTARREPPAPWWNRLGLWRGWAGLATAVALGLLAMVLAEPSPSPRLFAVLTAEDGRPVWLVSAAADERELGARQLAESLQPGRVPELWLLPTGANPVSLGLLDPGTTNLRTLERMPPGALSAGALLAVSLEPPGGSPTGLPTGPVISKGFLVADPS